MILVIDEAKHTGKVGPSLWATHCSQRFFKRAKICSLVNVSFLLQNVMINSASLSGSSS